MSDIVIDENVVHENGDNIVANDPGPADGAPADGAPADGAPADGAPADGAPATDGADAPAADAPADGAVATDGAPAAADGAVATDGAPADGAADGAPPPPPPPEPVITKVLFININMHPKNMNALTHYKDIVLTTIYNPSELNNYNLDNFDFVYSPGTVFDISSYPNTKFVFGPHVSIFPEFSFMNYLKDQPNAIYVQPSQWAADVWTQRIESNNVPIRVLPFGVDSDRFCELTPLNDRNNVFVYYKKRDPYELQKVLGLLEGRNISYRVFSYDERYDENEYLAYIQTCRYGIWVGEHESQGFALQEALSCNVPLLVWNVTSMSQEYGSGYCYIPASTIGYWNSQCGEFFTDASDLEPTFDKFIGRIEMTIAEHETFEFWGYRPREFILQHLSRDVCSLRFANIWSGAM